MDLRLQGLIFCVGLYIRANILLMKLSFDCCCYRASRSSFLFRTLTTFILLITFGSTRRSTETTRLETICGDFFGGYITTTPYVPTKTHYRVIKLEGKF